MTYDVNDRPQGGLSDIWCYNDKLQGGHGGGDRPQGGLSNAW